jgi:hypothetical protein
MGLPIRSPEELTADGAGDLIPKLLSKRLRDKLQSEGRLSLDELTCLWFALRLFIFSASSWATLSNCVQSSCIRVLLCVFELAKGRTNLESRRSNEDVPAPAHAPTPRPPRPR